MEQTCWPWKLAKYLTFIPKYKACSRHDKRYEFATIRNYKTRAKIDRIFYHQLKIEQPNRKITPIIYYIIVRLFGWIIFYFNYK